MLSSDRDGAALEEVAGSAGGVATAALSSIGCTELAVVPRSEAMCSSPICHATAKYSSPPVRTMRTCVAGCPSAYVAVEMRTSDSSCMYSVTAAASSGKSTSLRAAQPRVLGGGTLWCESNLEVAKLLGGERVHRLGARAA